MSHLTETGTFHRVLTVSLVVAVGALTGMLVMNVGPEFSRSLDLESAELWRSVARRSLERKTVALTLLVAGLAALYVVRAARSNAITINPFMVTNGFLFIAASSLFLPLISVRVMVLGAFCSAALHRPTSTERWSGFIVLLGICLGLVVTGPILAPLTGDQVRSRIPVGVQLLGTVPYLMAFGTVFCIKRLRWGLRHFESLFMVIIVGSVILSLEALMTFYMGRPSAIPGLGQSLLSNGMFQSALVQDHHTVSRMGLTATFMSLYFFTRRSQTRYLCFALAGVSVVVATMNRAPIMATGLGLGIYLLIGLSWHGIRRSEDSIRRMGAVLLAVVILGGGVQVVQGMSEARSVNDMSTAFAARLVHWARVADVVAYTPILGTGPGIDNYYLGSGSVPPVYLFTAAERLGVTEAWALSRVARSQLYFYQEGRGFSAHNVWANLVMQWGLLLGGLGVLYLVYQAFRAACTLALAPASVDTRAAWLALALSVSLGVSVLSTSKFNQFWFFAITFYFTAANLRQVRAKGEVGRSETTGA